MYNDITGIILSGGKSSRMGTNKAFLKLGDKNVIEVISGIMKSIFSNEILITNEPELYSSLNIDSYEDIYKGKGPLAGIHSGLTHSKTEKNFIISCDVPLITKDIIEFITEYPSDKQIKVPIADGYIQQLCGIYSRSTLVNIENVLNKNDNSKKCKVLNLLEATNAEIIKIENEMPGYEKNSFLNMNDNAQYLQAVVILEAKKNKA